MDFNGFFSKIINFFDMLINFVVLILHMYRILNSGLFLYRKSNLIK